MTTYEADPDADAVILGAYEMVYVNMRQDYAVKILSQEGVDRANIKIPYSRKERIASLQAQTINQGAKIKVSKKEIFDEEVTKTYNRKRFTFPNVQVGSIIEYRYTLESPYAAVLDTWYFQDDIPVRWSECRFSVPLYIEYVMITNTDRPFHIKEDRRTNIGNDDGRIYRFVMNDMKGLEEEKYVTTMKDYLNNIQFQAAKLTQPNGIVNKYIGPTSSTNGGRQTPVANKSKIKATTRKYFKMSNLPLHTSATPKKKQLPYTILSKIIMYGMIDLAIIPPRKNSILPTKKARAIVPILI